MVKGKKAWLSLLVAVVVLGVAIWFSQREDTPGGPSTGTATAADVQRARDELARLVVAPEDTGKPYDRDDWPHWVSQGDGCDTREEALKLQGTAVTTGAACKITSGSWTSRYDGLVITDSTKTDLDHVVPLAEANRSGTRGWTKKQRQAFANDLDQLLVVSASSNRSKGDQDPARWLPDAAYSCDYAVRWVDVKSKYALTVDQAEHEALNSLLLRCPR